MPLNLSRVKLSEHVFMAFKILRNWLRGIISDNDGLDMPEDSLAECRNYIIKPGMLEQREKAKQVITSDLTSLEEFQEFSIFDGSSTNRFILCKDGNDLEKFDYSGGSYSSASLWRGFLHAVSIC